MYKISCGGSKSAIDTIARAPGPLPFSVRMRDGEKHGLHRAYPLARAWKLLCNEIGRSTNVIKQAPRSVSASD